MQSPEHLAEHIRLHLEDNPEPITKIVLELRSPDIADALNLLTVSEAGEVLAILPKTKAIEICDQPTLRRRSALFEQLEPELAAHLLDGVAADQRTDIMRRMSLHGRRRLLPLLSALARNEVEQLLLYPEHSAGDLMTTEFVRLRPEMTIGQALEHIRSVNRSLEDDLSRSARSNRELIQRNEALKERVRALEHMIKTNIWISEKTAMMEEFSRIHSKGELT